MIFLLLRIDSLVRRFYLFQIWTRNDRGIRGYVLAYLIAFDKHWNLALEEVTEVWTRRKKRKVPALGK